MFDNISVSAIHNLPELPDSVIKNWTVRENVIFQTKSFKVPAMNLYHIDENGNLKVRRAEYEWHDGDPNGESIGDRLGYSKETEAWWEDSDFSGCIEFYESYDHHDLDAIDNVEHEVSKWYTLGWIEYRAFFKHGKLDGEFELVNHEIPRKYTQEEMDEITARNKAWREKMDATFIENRKKYPTTEQKLIDQIYEETNPKSAITIQEDLGQALSNIRGLIESYREKHDIWFGK